MLRSPAALGEQRQDTRGRENREAPAAVRLAGFSSARLGICRTGTFTTLAEWRQNQDQVGGRERGPKRWLKILPIPFIKFKEYSFFLILVIVFFVKIGGELTFKIVYACCVKIKQ